MPNAEPQEAPAPSRALAGFVRDALVYASARSVDAEARLLDSPYSAVPRDDARALIVAARERERPVDAIAAKRVPLSHDAAQAAYRFTVALAAIERALRAQGTTAAEVVAEIAIAFALEERSTPPERATLAAVRAVAETFDRARIAADAPWEAEALVAALEEAPALQPRDAATARAPEALGPLEPETAAPVPVRRGHQSASSLGAFAECERKWYYRYVCAAVEDRGSSASAYGSAFHYALEQFHGEFPRADETPRERLASKLDAYVVDAFERYRIGFPTNVEFELQKRRARRTAVRYLDWFVERSKAHPFAVVGREEEADVEFDGFRFVGYIDRLDRDDATGAVTVVDYKTGSIATTAAEYRDKIARFVDFQLPFYYWARTEAGDRVQRLALVPLKESQLDVRPIELEVVPVPAAASRKSETTGTIGIDELRRARARMVELSRTLAETDVEHFAVAADRDACQYCAYVNGCRDRPPRREDRFGR